jgi:hypothetical protein
LIEWKSILFSVFPAHPGIQADSCLNQTRTWMSASARTTIWVNLLAANAAHRRLV